jgi:hypothetical protein
MLPPPVIYPFFVGSIEEFQKRAAKKRPRPARFWQSACPHAVLDVSLSIRRLDRRPCMGGSRLLIQKNGNIQKSQPGHREEAEPDKGFEPQSHEGTNLSFVP